MLKLNPTAKRQWQHTMIVVATILAASLFGVNALQPFAAAANLETDAKAENGEGGVRVKDVKSSQLIFKNSKNSKNSKSSKSSKFSGSSSLVDIMSGRQYVSHFNFFCIFTLL